MSWSPSAGPRGDRGSYKQWEEGGIAPQVVFEVLSPGNRAGEMRRKFQFYQRYGVEEYYIYDPDDGIPGGLAAARGGHWSRSPDDGLCQPSAGYPVRAGRRSDNLTIFGPMASRS